MIASSDSKRIVLIENGDVVVESNLSITGDGPLGNHVFVLKGPHEAGQGMSWSAISHGTGGPSADATSPDGILQRLRSEDAFIAALQQRMHPGMVVVLTDAPLHPDARSGKDFCDHVLKRRVAYAGPLDAQSVRTTANLKVPHASTHPHRAVAHERILANAGARR